MQSRRIEFRAIDREEASQRSHDGIRLDPDEIYFFEPDVLQLDSADIMRAMHTVNHAYFRHGRGSILQLHQPRDRAPAAITSTFGRSMMNPAGADVIFDASNCAVTQT